MLKLITPVSKKSVNLQNIEDSESQTENVSPVTTSTPTKSKTATL